MTAAPVIPATTELRRSAPGWPASGRWCCAGSAATPSAAARPPTGTVSRVYETWDDRTEIDWGTVTEWEPPERFTMTWTGTPAATEVEFTFAALGPALTRVTVEHRGWEALTEAQLAEDCALPGGYTSGAYSQGWATILACLARAVVGDSSAAR